MVAIIGAIVAALAGVFSSIISSNNNERTNATNLKLAAQNNQTQIELQRMQNDYNDPSNQVRRLSAAGINPALAMSQSGLIDSGNQHSLPTMSAATMQPYQMDTSAFQSSATILSQKKLLDAQSHNLEVDAAKKLTEMPNAERERAESQAREDKSRKEIESIEQQIAASKSEVEQSTLRTLAEVRKIDADIAHVEAQRNLTQKEVDTYDQRIKVELENLQANTKSLVAQARKTTADAIEQEHDTKVKDAWLYGNDGTKYSVRYAEAKNIINQMEVYQHQMDALIDEATRVHDAKGLTDIMYRVNLISSALQGTISKLQQAGMAVATKKP